VKLGIIVGPGHHHQTMMNAFKQRNYPFRYAVYWPRLQVYDVDESGEERLIYSSQFYNIVSKILWSIWYRLPIKRKRRLHREWLFRLYDRLVCRFFQNYDLVIGWSQVSLYTMKKLKRNGGQFILEHPMVHASYWNRVIKEEYKKYGKINNTKSIRSVAMVKRMKKEYVLADKINLLSTFAKNTFLSENLPVEKLMVTPLGTDINIISLHQENITTNKFIVLCVGRLELLKGVQYLLEAFRELNLPDAELWLVGAIQEEFKPILKEYKGFFHFLGEKNKQELWTLYLRADVVVFPSLLDAFGLVIIEAMMAGTPVIATRTSAAEDLIKNERSGAIVPPADATAIKDAILRYYDTREKLKNKSASSKLAGYHITDYHKSLIQNINL